MTILPAFLIHPWNFDIARLLEPAILFNLLFLGVLASLICFVVWNVVLKQLGTIRASNYIYLNPLFTLVGSAFLLGEQLTIVALMGAILILGGVYWAGKNKYKINEGVSKQAHPLFISDTVRQFVYAAISRIGDFKNSQFIP